MIYLVRLAVAAAAMACASAASAATTNYAVTSAVGSGNDHALWIGPGLGSEIGQDFDFDPAGNLMLWDDGMGGLDGRLTGTIFSQKLATAGFMVNFVYDSVWAEGFTPTFKSENGSRAAADTFYLDLEYGVLTGVGDLAGLIIDVVRKPPLDADETGPGNGGTPDYATQIGGSDGTNKGANNKNFNFGMANWFTMTVREASCGLFCDLYDYQTRLNGRQGDINADLAAVPLPAGAVLLVSGLAGLFVARRRTKI